MKIEYGKIYHWIIHIFGLQYFTKLFQTLNISQPKGQNNNKIQSDLF